MMNQWLDRALKIIPGGSQTYSKSYRYFSKPVFAISGYGGLLMGDDGIEYLDMSMALGAVILGYKDKSWLSTLNIPSGLNFSCPHPIETEVAEKLHEIIPSAEMIKFFKNGSDATEIAVRLARAYTGKDIILAGGYHGFHDWYIQTIDKNNGVRFKFTEYVDDVKLNLDFKNVYQFHNYGELYDLFYNYIDDGIAGVILEPTMPDVEVISEVTRTNGAILIFDEVLSGFRYSLGGYQSLIKIIPDISCFGKCMANGLALSAVVGRTDIMKLLDEDVFGSSTFGGETVSLAACLNVIENLAKDGQHLWYLGGRWMTQMDIMIRAKNLTGIIELEGLSPRCGVKFKDYGGISAAEFQSLYQQELQKRKILTHGINNFALAHTEAQINYFISCADEVLDIISKAKADNTVKGYLKGEPIRVMFRR